MDSAHLIPGLVRNRGHRAPIVPARLFLGSPAWTHQDQRHQLCECQTWEAADSRDLREGYIPEPVLLSVDRLPRKVLMYPISTTTQLFNKASGKVSQL